MISKERSEAYRARWKETVPPPWVSPRDLRPGPSLRLALSNEERRGRGRSLIGTAGAGPRHFPVREPDEGLRTGWCDRVLSNQRPWFGSSWKSVHSGRGFSKPRLNRCGRSKPRACAAPGLSAPAGSGPRRPVAVTHRPRLRSREEDAGRARGAEARW